MQIRNILNWKSVPFHVVSFFAVERRLSEIKNICATFKGEDITDKRFNVVRGVSILIIPDIISVVVFIMSILYVSQLLNILYSSLFLSETRWSTLGVGIHKIRSCVIEKGKESALKESYRTFKVLKPFQGIEFTRSITKFTKRVARHSLSFDLVKA